MSGSSFSLFNSPVPSPTSSLSEGWPSPDESTPSQSIGSRVIASPVGSTPSGPRFGSRAVTPLTLPSGLNIESPSSLSPLAKGPRPLQPVLGLMGESVERITRPNFAPVVVDPLQPLRLNLQMAIMTRPADILPKFSELYQSTPVQSPLAPLPSPMNMQELYFFANLAIEKLSSHLFSLSVSSDFSAKVLNDWENSPWIKGGLRALQGKLSERLAKKAADLILPRDLEGLKKTYEVLLACGKGGNPLPVETCGVDLESLLPDHVLALLSSDHEVHREFAVRLLDELPSSSIRESVVGKLLDLILEQKTYFPFAVLNQAEVWLREAEERVVNCDFSDPTFASMFLRRGNRWKNLIIRLSQVGTESSVKKAYQLRCDLSKMTPPVFHVSGGNFFRLNRGLALLERKLDLKFEPFRRELGKKKLTPPLERRHRFLREKVQRA